jgi:tetratricopeptide (TPR) repeat protein
MLEGPLVNPGELNNLAWQIATSAHPTQRALATAAELAEMAVTITGRREPTLLDTLAEVYFAQGRTEDALRTIDDAIALAPGVTYYEQQRRRFAGERAANDRPPPPPSTPRQDGDRGVSPRDLDEPPPGERDLPPGDEITV